MGRRYGNSDHIIQSYTSQGKASKEGAGGRMVDVEQFHVRAWCGEHTTTYSSKHSVHGYSMLPSSLSCSKCSSKFWAAELAAKPNGYILGGRIDLSASAPDPYHRYMYQGLYGVSTHSWKSVYPVIDTSIVSDVPEEKIVAFIAIPTGFGQSWQVQPWTSRQTNFVEKVMSGDWPLATPGMSNTKPVEYYKRAEFGDKAGEKSSYKMPAHNYPSKEFALNLIPHMVEDGVLPTYASIVAEDQLELDRRRQYKADREADEVRRTKERQEREEQKSVDYEHIKDVLRELLYPNHNDRTPFSNYEREGLMLAAKHLGLEITPPPAPVAVDPPAEPGPKYRDGLTPEQLRDKGWYVPEEPVMPETPAPATETAPQAAEEPSDALAAVVVQAEAEKAAAAEPETDEWGEVIS